MSEELKLCPFCGGEAKVIQLADDEHIAKYLRNTWVVGCEGSSLCYGYLWNIGHVWTDKESAVKAWNTRAERTAKVSNQFVFPNRPDVILTKLGDCECGRKVSWWYKYCPDCGCRLEWK